MEKNRIITIVVMVYKNFTGLEKTINSIISQKYENIELIVSDDGSDNFKTEYFDKYEEVCQNRFDNYTLIHNEINQGTVKHFNSIIRMSKGEIICPLSCGDIFIDENVVDVINEHFNKTNCLLCTAKREELAGAKRVLPKNFELKKLVNCNKSLNSIMLHGNFIGGATTYYKKEVFEKYGYFDEKYRLCEDLPFFIKMLSNNVIISALNEVTIGYDMSGVSSGKKRNTLLDQDYVNIFKDTLVNESSKLSFFTKRALKYRIEKYGTNINKIILTFKYIDIVAIIGISTIINNWRK